MALIVVLLNRLAIFLCVAFECDAARTGGLAHCVRNYVCDILCPMTVLNNPKGDFEGAVVLQNDRWLTSVVISPKRFFNGTAGTFPARGRVVCLLLITE